MKLNFENTLQGTCIMQGALLLLLLLLLLVVSFPLVASTNSDCGFC